MFESVALARTDRFAGQIPLCNVLSDFIRQLDQAENIDGLRDALADAVSQFNCRYFHYHVIRSRGEISPGARLPYWISTYPAEWIERYRTHCYLDDDPLIARALTQRDAFTWAEVLWSESANLRHRQFYDDIRAMDLDRSVAFPLHGKNGEIAVLHLVPDLSIQTASHAFSLDTLSVLHLMAWHYHGQAYKPLLAHVLTEGSRRQSLLSDREQGVLEWTAKGKSTAEIALILNLSGKTVDFHIENVKRKLQVYNRTHAVAKAIMLGLLISL